MRSSPPVFSSGRSPFRDEVSQGRISLIPAPSAGEIVLLSWLGSFSEITAKRESKSVGHFERTKRCRGSDDEDIFVGVDYALVSGIPEFQIPRRNVDE